MTILRKIAKQDGLEFMMVTAVVLLVLIGVCAVTAIEIVTIIYSCPK